MTVIITVIILPEILPANNAVMDIKGAGFICCRKAPLSGLAGVNKLWCVCWWAVSVLQHCWDATEVRATDTLMDGKRPSRFNRFDSSYVPLFASWLSLSFWHYDVLKFFFKTLVLPHGHVFDFLRCFTHQLTFFSCHPLIGWFTYNQFHIDKLKVSLREV